MAVRVAATAVIILLSTWHLLAQDISRPSLTDPKTTLDRITALVEKGKYKAAIGISLAAAVQMEARSDWKGYISFMLRAAEIETFEVWKGKGFREAELYPDYKRPLKYLQSLQAHAGKKVDDYPALKSKELFTSAVVYYWLNAHDTSEMLHKQALDLERKVYGETSRETADSYLWMGVLYHWGFHRKDLAVKNYRLAAERQKKFMPASRYALGSVYYGLANIAMENFEFDEALTLANQFLALYHDIRYEQAFGLQLIANIYWNKNDFEKSLDYRRQAVNIYEQSAFREDLIIEYSNLSNDLSKLRRFQEARQVLKKGARILNGSKEKDPYYARMLFASFGDLYRSMKDYDSAAAYFTQALAIALRQYGEQNDEVADIYRMRGEMFTEQVKFEEALGDYQKMLSAVIPGFASRDYRAIPEIQYDNPYLKNIIAASFYKGDALLAWYLRDGVRDHLLLALENYRHGCRQILAARTSIGDDLSKPVLVSNFRESIEKAMQCAHILFEENSDVKLIQDILYFMEFTKYLNVLDALQRADRANNSGVPLQSLFRLESITSELNNLQRTGLMPAHVVPRDSLTKIREKILDLIQTRRQLITEMAGYTRRTQHPDEMIIQMADIQRQLRPDEEILEFFWGKDSIYTVALTDESASVSVVSNDPELDSLFSSVHSMLVNPPSFKEAQVRNYSSWTSQIYRKFFHSLLKKEKVVVIPDGPLSTVPLEALVASHHPDKFSFRDLPYVIYDHEISYAYSSSILFHRAAHTSEKIEHVLAFSYSGSPETRGGGTHRQGELPGAFREIQALSGLFENISLFSGKDALKMNFMKHAKDYDLIHLGLHGVADAAATDNSRLVFRSDSLDTDDLYAYEIYNMHFAARLVVLSACESGVGSHQDGEGTFSIARAFSYAGCPSVVMSLWRVNDAHTASIMEEFYKRLQDGNPVGASLREAKENFLRYSDEFSSHPANWSSFILNGQDQTFEGRMPMDARYLLMGVLLAFFLVYLAYRRKRRPA